VSEVFEAVELSGNGEKRACPFVVAMHDRGQVTHLVPGDREGAEPVHPDWGRLRAAVRRKFSKDVPAVLVYETVGGSLDVRQLKSRIVPSVRGKVIYLADSEETLNRELGGPRIPEVSSTASRSSWFVATWIVALLLLLSVGGNVWLGVLVNSKATPGSGLGGGGDAGRSISDDVAQLTADLEDEKRAHASALEARRKALDRIKKLEQGRSGPPPAQGLGSMHGCQSDGLTVLSDDKPVSYCGKNANKRSVGLRPDYIVHEGKLLGLSDGATGNYDAGTFKLKLTQLYEEVQLEDEWEDVVTWITKAKGRKAAMDACWKAAKKKTPEQFAACMRDADAHIIYAIVADVLPTPPLVTQ